MPTRIITPRVTRLLRTAATAVILVRSTVLVVLWVRNFWRADVVWVPLPGQGHLVIASLEGQMELALYLPSPSSPGTPMRFAPRSRTPPRWRAQSYSVTWNHLHEILFPHAKPFRYRRLPRSQGVNIIAPLVPVPAAWLLAAAPWIRWSTRFSLRALMIATTLVAIALGIYVRSGW